MKPAIIAITRNGSALALRLRDACKDGADVYLPEKFAREACGIKVIKGELSSAVGGLLDRYRSIVFIMAAGIVVRLIAPHIRDKRTDPAVVVMDEEGRHAISLLSGHSGGANRLAGEVARLTGATPVITTASDVRGVPSVDMLTQSLGCAVEDWSAARKVTAALVNGETVSVYCSLGPERLAEAAQGFPDNVRVFSSVEDIPSSKAAAAIIITPFLVDGIEDWPGDVAVLRPRTMVVGVGCNRGTIERQIAWLYDRTLKRHSLSPLSVRNIATISEKRDEEGLTEFAKSRGLKIEYIPKARLKKAATPSGPSDAVYRNMGVYGVCEPAALVSAGAKRLLVEKRKTKDVTIAVAEVGG